MFVSLLKTAYHFNNNFQYHTQIEAHKHVNLSYGNCACGLYDSSNLAATALLRGVQRADLQDGVHSLPRHVDWHVRGALARSLAVGNAEDVVDVAVIGESVAPDSIAFYFGNVCIYCLTVRSLPC